MDTCCECGTNQEVESSYCGSFCRQCFETHCVECGVCGNDTAHPFYPEVSKQETTIRT